MLGHRADDMIPLALHAFGTGEQGPVVALRTAGGENELCRAAAQCRCHRSTGAVEELFGFPAGGVSGARVPKLPGHGEKRSLRGFGADLRGGGIIQIMHCVLPYSAQKALRAFGALITSFIFLLLRYFIVDFRQGYSGNANHSTLTQKSHFSAPVPIVPVLVNLTPFSLP